ncbi:MAG: hypothetical protein MUD16_03620 [Desulfobacterales bacterium]|nr:hypothetical protein [Desulfobacterales bacterium]
MRCAGIDIGSRSVKLVVVANHAIVECRQADTGYDGMAAARSLLDGVTCDRILATGCGRGQFEVDFEAPTVTEIKAHAARARCFFPEAATVLDIGGQDSKAIAFSLHTSALRRAAGMLRRVSTDGPLVFSGGVAKNHCMRRLLEEALQQPVLAADDPQIVGPVGAAVLAGNYQPSPRS